MMKSTSLPSTATPRGDLAPKAPSWWHALLPAGTPMPFSGDEGTSRPVFHTAGVADWPRVLQILAATPLHTLLSRYRGPLSFGRGRRDARSVGGGPDADALALFQMGLSVYLHDAAKLLPGGVEFLAEVERALGAPRGSARLTLFASPAGDGVPVHFDGEDVISVQLQGHKRFRVGAEPALPHAVGPQHGPGMKASASLHAQCPEGLPQAPAEVGALSAFEMQPGTVLWVPRGHWHETEALSDSLSVSIVLSPPPALEWVLQALRAQLLSLPAWRRPVYGAAQAELESLLATLPELIGGHVDLGALLPEHDAGDPATIGADARFQRSAGASLTVAQRLDRQLQIEVQALDDGWHLRTTLDRTAGASLEMPLRWLAGHAAAFRADHLSARFPFMAFRDVQSLLHGLVESGYLCPLPRRVI
jgi:hypothetical protein